MGGKKVEVNTLSGERIKEFCKKKGITQLELAQSIGYTGHTISQVATGKRGLSSNLADDIVKKFPDISRDWLMGDPQATMNGRGVFLGYRDAFKKLQALENLLVFTDFSIDYENPFTVEGASEEFCNLFYRGKSVALSERSRDDLVDAVLSMIESFLGWVVDSGDSAEHLAGVYSHFTLNNVSEYENEMEGLECEKYADDSHDDYGRKYAAHFRPGAQIISKDKDKEGVKDGQH